MADRALLLEDQPPVGDVAGQGRDRREAVGRRLRVVPLLGEPVHVGRAGVHVGVGVAGRRTTGFIMRCVMSRQFGTQRVANRQGQARRPHVHGRRRRGPIRGRPGSHPARPSVASVRLGLPVRTAPRNKFPNRRDEVDRSFHHRAFRRLVRVSSSAMASSSDCCSQCSRTRRTRASSQPAGNFACLIIVSSS